MRTKSDDHMMYDSWDMVRDRWSDGQKWHKEVGAPSKNSATDFTPKNFLKTYKFKKSRVSG